MYQVMREGERMSQQRSPDCAKESRFALYYVPERESLWWERGCRWLGRDPETGATLTECSDLTACTETIESLTRVARRYGWHGTLVPPARLKQGVTFEQVLSIASQWAARQTAFQFDAKAAVLGKFAALRPAVQSDEAALSVLAASALRELQGLRAGLTAVERERRLSKTLTSRQISLLEEWGYPYVLDEFRFHMTLSDECAPEEVRSIVEHWSKLTFGIEPLTINQAALFIEPAPGANFELAARLPFRGHL